MPQIRRLGLVGLPGAGKSTIAGLIRSLCALHGIGFSLLRLAEPLYDAQEAIYRIARLPLPSRYSQDGELLNFLGGHLRKLNPMVLLDDFRRRLEEIESRGAELHCPMVVVCDDVRYSDTSLLRDLGFRLIRIDAPPELCLSRRQLRSDLTLGSANHHTEAEVEQIVVDAVIHNTGTLDELSARVEEILSKELI